MFRVSPVWSLPTSLHFSFSTASLLSIPIQQSAVTGWLIDSDLDNAETVDSFRSIDVFVGCVSVNGTRRRERFANVFWAATIVSMSHNFVLLSFPMVEGGEERETSSQMVCGLFVNSFRWDFFLFAIPFATNHRLSQFDLS